MVDRSVSGTSNQLGECVAVCMAPILREIAASPIFATMFAQEVVKCKRKNLVWEDVGYRFICLSPLP